MSDCPQHGPFETKECPICGYRPKRQRTPSSKPDAPYVPTLCQRCTRGSNAQMRLGKDWVCVDCYEELREDDGGGNAIERKRREILDAHPEWKRGAGEDSAEYANRMIAIGKELSARSGVKHVRFGER